MNINFKVTHENIEQVLKLIELEFGYEITTVKKDQEPELEESEIIEDDALIEGDAPQDDIIEEPQIEKVHETEIIYGVNFRNKPNTESYVYQMISKGTMIHVIEEVDTDWLKIETKDGTVGYISAQPKYSTYSSKSLEEKRIDKLFAYGEQFLGAPYVFGAKIGETNESGQRVFDCSSFVKTIYKDVLDINLPRTSYNQAEVSGEEIAKDELKRGDIVFFTSRGLPIGHVGVYAGNDRVFHTYGSGGVRYTGFKGTQWEERFVKGKRVYNTI